MALRHGCFLPAVFAWTDAVFLPEHSGKIQGVCISGGTCDNADRLACIFQQKRGLAQPAVGQAALDGASGKGFEYPVQVGAVDI